MSSGTPRERSPELRRRLLEASPDELTELVRQQPELAGVVDRLLAANREIDTTLDRTDPRHRSDARHERPPRRDPVPRRFRGRLPAALGLAAAVVVAWLIVGRGGPEAGGGGPAIGPSASASTLSAELAVEAESDFAVFPTDDPDMAVVWVFNHGAD